MTRLNEPLCALFSLGALAFACSEDAATNDSMSATTSTDGTGTTTNSSSTSSATNTGASSTGMPTTTSTGTASGPMDTASSSTTAPTGGGGSAGMPTGTQTAMGGTSGTMSGGAGSVGGGGMGGFDAGGSSGAFTAGASADGGMGGAEGTAGGGAGGMSGEFMLTAPWDSDDDCSPDNPDACSLIPAQNTMVDDNANEMPELSWTEGPAGTQSYALVYHDHSFQQQGMPFVHWAMWNIPADVTSVSADSIPGEAEEASFQGGGWAGSGACGNVYELLLYALSEPTIDAMNQTDVRNLLGDADASLVLASDSVFGRTGAPNCNE